MMNQHATLECLLALHARGVLEALPTHGDGADVETLARERGCDPRILTALLDYVALTTPLVTREGHRYKAQPETRGRIVGFVLDMATAYAPVFRSLPELLSGQKVYGRDVQREGDALGRASGFATRATIPIIARRFDERGVRQVVDFGCGGGEVLMSLCEKSGRHGVGVDIDAGAAALTRQRLQTRGLADRVTVVEADMADPQPLDAIAFESPLGVCSVGVVHEFLRDGDDALVAVLSGWRRRFAGAVFCIAEFDAASFDEMKAGDEETLLGASYYQLIHPLSGQGDPQPEARWRELFARAGFRVVHVDRVPIRFLVFTLE